MDRERQFKGEEQSKLKPTSDYLRQCHVIPQHTIRTFKAVHAHTQIKRGLETTAINSDTPISEYSTIPPPHPLDTH